MSVTSRVESLLQEALAISDVHPSKDARAFAGHVAAHLSKCLSDDQPITAEWLKEQGWVCNDDRGHCRHPTIVNLWFVGWYNPGDQQEIVWDAYFNDDILRFKGVRNRSDLLTLIRLIEGCDE